MSTSPTLSDATGRILWQTGQPEADGRLPQGAVRWGSDWYDADGERLLRHEIWKLVEIRDERRLASGASDRERFELVVPVDAVRPVTLQARLRHRRFRPDFVEWVLGPGAGRDVPTTDVAELTEPVPSSCGST